MPGDNSNFIASYTESVRLACRIRPRHESSIQHQQLPCPAFQSSISMQIHRKVRNQSRKPPSSVDRCAPLAPLGAP